MNSTSSDHKERAQILRRHCALVLMGCCSMVTACSEAHRSERALSDQGLYSEILSKQVEAGAFEYEPDHALWADGAEKRRWLFLPKGEQIDTSDMDHWQFPLGTKLFKEFSQNGQLLETRLIERVAETGRFDRDYKFATFVWNEEQSDAYELDGGVRNVLRSEHDVPAQKLCRECHRGEPGAVLGVSALQLSSSGTLQLLAAGGWLSHDPERSFELPDDPVTADAIGYIHANCGHCHSDTGQSSSDMRLHLNAAELDEPIEASALYRTTLMQRITEWKERPPAFELRVVPGKPEQSALYYRMTSRGTDEPTKDQMPPLATKQVDRTGVDLIRAWIESLTPESLAREEQLVNGTPQP